MDNIKDNSNNSNNSQDAMSMYLQEKRNGKIVKRFEGHFQGESHLLSEYTSDQAHIFVYIIFANAQRNYHILFTEGMSDGPMKVPQGMQDFELAELMTFIPTDWPIDDLENNPDNFWPIQLLIDTAVYPHEYNTWLASGHTVANGNPAKKYSANTELCGVMVYKPDFPSFMSPLLNIKIPVKKTVNIYYMQPLYESEMKYAVDNGSRALFEKFRQYNIPYTLDEKRLNVCD